MTDRWGGGLLYQLQTEDGQPKIQTAIFPNSIYLPRRHAASLLSFLLGGG